VLATSIGLAPAADKSGVSPNTISLPKGPGSIEGLGESFQPTLNTGTAKYALAIKLPSGAAGHQPSLALAYEGGGGNDPLGYGWSLSLPHIQRRTDKGIPTYGQSLGVQRPDTFITESREELVPTADGFFFCENEGSFIRYRQVGDHWEGTAPDGTRLEFGITTNGRIAEATQTFSWLLERETDTRGNVIEYVYQPFPGGQNLNQKYVALVRYGPGSPPWTAFHFVTFEYEDRPDWFEDGRAGFLVRTGKRLRSIRVATQGVTLTNHLAGDFNGDGVTDYLNRRYDLDYLAYAGAASHWSLLAGVTLRGADGVTSLPTATFDYAVSHPPSVVDAASNVWASINAPNAVMDNPQVELIDLNADGLPDLLKTDAGGGGHTAAVNRGPVRQGSNWVIQWADPVPVDPGTGAAWNFDLASDQTHLADMDGDGLADLVHKTADESVFYFANRGRLGWSERRDMASQNAAPPAPFGNPGVRTADVDFDKRIDIIQSIDFGGSVGYRAWFNLGNQNYSTPQTVEPEAGFDLALPGVQIVDCNGDRVPDVARIQPGAVRVAAGLGYGRFAPAQSLVLPDFALDDQQIASAKLTDINGDGLADLVLERAAPGVCWYWLNLGNYTLDTRRVITGLPDVSSGTAVRWADLNGNGTTDLIYGDATAEPRLQMVELGQLLSGGLAPNLLTRIANGIGRVTTIEYAPSTRFALEDEAANRPWPDPLPFPVTVVASILVSDSLGHEYTTHYRYHDGYYDPVEKQFRGFGEVEQIDLGDASAPTLVSRSHFDTGRFFDAMKGRLLRASAETEDGGVFSRETTTWANPPRLVRTGTNGVAVRFAHPVASVKEILERGAGTPRRIESETEYDDYGNVTRLSDYGIVENGDRSAFDDERITVTEFAVNLTRWIVHAPMRQTIRDENGGVISCFEMFYDDETFSGNNLGSVTVGNLTLRRDWIDPASATAYVNSVRTKYDSYGNSVLTLDPLAPDSGNTASGHVREMAYDALLHIYAESESIHIGGNSPPLVARASYDAGLGTVTRSLDFNGNATSYGYDALGRLTSLTKPGDSAAFPTAEYDYQLAVPVAYPVAGGLVRTGLVNHVETRMLDRTPGTAGARRNHYFISRQFGDGLGRSLMTRTEAEPAEGSSASRVAVTGAMLFNARSKPVRALNPFFTSQTGSLDELLAFENIEAYGWQGQFHLAGDLVSLDLASAHQTSTEYDATLRVIRATNPDGTSGRTEFEPLVVRGFDENDNDPDSPHFNTPMIQFTDGLGRLIRVDEIVRLNDDGTPSATAQTWTTRYRYDLNDRLTRITDAQNNVKELRYDGLRRKVWMNDPDAGISTNRYDEASNVIETVDAKGQRITYSYDGANRILSEDYHDETSPEFGYHRSPDIAYHYDAPAGPVDQGDGSRATARNNKGTLAWVEDTSGREHTSFDVRGRVEWTVKQIPDPVLAPTLSFQPETAVAYKTAFEYDSLDRVTRMVYPDNDEVTYRYNARNLLEGITGGPSGHILSRVTYLPSAQQERIDYGNGVRTTYDYDARQRMSRLFTRHTSLSTELVHFTYDLDAVSNLDAIHDQRPVSAVPLDHRRRNSQRFAYDSLYRLTKVQYNQPNHASANGGEINYRYDRIGNMLAQTSDIAHTENGVSVTDLGTMAYGGAAGRAGRAGRQPSDPPGPHALTGLQHSSTNRAYSYDANGNMREIDGLRCTWDFRDRLVAVEDDRMRAEYRYDFTGRRIIKRVSQKPFTNSPPSTLGPQSSAVTYPGKHFEVREHDEPTKYVFNGGNRVARITGSLSPNMRIQRFRLYPGWNLLSLAVDEARLPLSAEISAIYQWNPATPGLEPSDSTANLPAGTVLWIKATTNAKLALIGTYLQPTKQTLAPGGVFLPNAGFEAWNLRSSLDPGDTQAATDAWHFDLSSQCWLSHLPSISNSDPGFPEYLAPGQAIFINADAPSDLAIPDPALRIRYYHQDHLGSSSALTDANGELAGETAFYPFGLARHEHRLRQVEENYKFAQKERDRESGLDYLEARFLAATLSRFPTVDAKYANPDALSGDALSAFLSRPQMGNLFAYVLNNPLRYSDPTGLGPWKWFRENVWIPVVDPLDQLDGARTAKVVGGGVEATVGAIACPATGVGCAAAVHGTDVFVSGVLDEPSLTSKGITAVTGSETAGEVGDFLVGVALGVGASRTPPRLPLGAPKSGPPQVWPEIVYEPPVPTTPTFPGWNAPGVLNNHAARVESLAARTAEAYRTAVNATPRQAWIQATVNATREYRLMLPTLDEQADALQACYKAADAVFSP
jgi:RHS repeat-associated protein